MVTALQLGHLIWMVPLACTVLSNMRRKQWGHFTLSIGFFVNHILHSGMSHWLLRTLLFCFYKPPIFLVK